VRAIFFGTPKLAVPSLEALHEIADVVRVICQPDQPAGRGMKLRAPPVKERALELGLEVAQPTKVRPPEFAAELAALNADVALVIAYGRILPKAVLEAPRRGCVNVHASLLPRWRGAGPIQWAIASGDAETGVCLMQMDEGMDTGAVIAIERTPIDPNETAAVLGDRLATMAAALVREKLRAFVDGAIGSTPQPAEGVTLAPLLKKEDGRIDWRMSAQAIHDRARAFNPWPGAYTDLDGKRVKIDATRVSERDGALGEPGTIIDVSGDLRVACGRGAVSIVSVTPEGKRSMAAKQFTNGYRVSPGMRFS
jgi:methionyl-tRNA formyltransferase